MLARNVSFRFVYQSRFLCYAQVKMAYRKAMLLVHPDKCGSLGPEERLIAKRVFEAVNEAYTIFSEKEMGG